MKNAYINTRVDSKTKSEAEAILNELGINISTAINMFLSQIILKEGIPFEVCKPKTNKKRELMKLAQAINLTGGKDYPKKFTKLFRLYSNGDISYEVALYAIKREFTNV